VVSRKSISGHGDSQGKGHRQRKLKLFIGNTWKAGAGRNEGMKGEDGSRETKNF
jgi:hypothetical protein